MAPSPDPAEPDSLRREPWAAHARQWNRLGPPLRPCSEDLERLSAAWRRSLPGTALPAGRLEVLSLGVTPEIAEFPWAEDFFLTAVDASERMIRAVWPGDGPRRRAIQADWLALPFAGGDFGLVLSDCGLAPLSAPGQLGLLAAELRRVLRPDGRVVMRHLVRPSPPEPVEAVVLAADSGAIGGFHELKLRLLMALPAGACGVRLGDAWECFQRCFPDRQVLAERLKCSPDTIATVDAYRERDACYVFPTLAELAGIFSGFTLTPGPAGHYPFAAACPVFTLTPNP